MDDILMALLVLATIIMLSVVGYSFLKNKLSAVKSIGAVVDRKWMRDFDVDLPTGMAAFSSVMSWLGDTVGYNRRRTSLPLDDTLATLGVTSVYFVSFRTAERAVDLAVPEDVYADLFEGDGGLLTYRGEEFHRFIKDKGDSEPVSPLPTHLNRTTVTGPRNFNGGDNV